MAILKGLVISVSGDVGPRPDQLRKWVEANGGKWLPHVSKGVTHLICSKEHWKKSNEAVSMALRLGVMVVNYDWLEDSLQKGRKLSEKKYCWSSIQKKKKKLRLVKNKGRQFDVLKFEKGADEARTETGSDNYHVYVDATGFEYKVIVVRPNRFRSTQAIATIWLFESNTKPHTYCTVFRYTPAPGISWAREDDLIHTPGIPGVIYPPPNPDGTINTSPLQSLQRPQITTNPTKQDLNPQQLALQNLLNPPKPSSKSPYRHILCPLNSTFPTAFTLFRQTFRTFTLAHWHERHRDDLRSLQTSRAINFNLEPYFYRAPDPGSPRGILPDGPLACQKEEQEPYHRTFTPGGMDLPGMNVPLNREGPIGGQMMRDAEAERRRREEEEVRKVEEERMRRKAAKAARMQQSQSQSQTQTGYYGYGGMMMMPPPQGPPVYGGVQGPPSYGVQVQMPRERFAKSPFFEYQR